MQAKFGQSSEFRSQIIIEVVLSMLSMSLSMLWQMSLVGWLGLGARSWVRICLGDKVRVSISYYLIYVKTCSEQFGTGFRRTAPIYFYVNFMLISAQ